MTRKTENVVEKDNWLEKQRELERKVSVWDFDDAKKLRSEHEEDCEADQLARLHELRHQKRVKVDYKATGSEYNKQVGPWFIMFVGIYIFMVMISPFMLSETHMLAISILGIGLFFGLLIGVGIRKQLPPESYWKSIIIISVTIEIIGIAMSIIKRLY